MQSAGCELATYLLDSKRNLSWATLYDKLRLCHRIKSLHIGCHLHHLGGASSDLLVEVLHVVAARSQCNFCMFALGTQQGTWHYRFSVDWCEIGGDVARIVWLQLFEALMMEILQVPRKYKVSEGTVNDKSHKVKPYVTLV